jgi:hypothetical protein
MQMEIYLTQLNEEIMILHKSTAEEVTVQNKSMNSEDITFICMDHEQIRLYVET